MTLKVYIVFLGVHFLCWVAEIWAQSEVDPSVGWESIGPIGSFTSAMAGLNSNGGLTFLLRNPFNVLDVLGGVIGGLWGMFAFTGYENVFGGGFEWARDLLFAVGMGVLFMTVWRVMGGVIASVIGNISGSIGKILPFGG